MRRPIISEHVQLTVEWNEYQRKATFSTSMSFVDWLMATVLVEREVAESMKEVEKAKLPCGHSWRYGFTPDGGKTGYCVMCRVEQLEKIPHYVEKECECMMPILPGRTKHQYGLDLLKVLAAELRQEFSIRET